MSEKAIALKAQKVEEVAETAVFLAENDYITGQVIPVDGGMTIQEGVNS